MVLPVSATSALSGEGVTLGFVSTGREEWGAWDAGRSRPVHLRNSGTTNVTTTPRAVNARIPTAILWSLVQFETLSRLQRDCVRTDALAVALAISVADSCLEEITLLLPTGSSVREARAARIASSRIIDKSRSSLALILLIPVSICADNAPPRLLGAPVPKVCVNICKRTAVACCLCPSQKFVFSCLSSLRAASSNGNPDFA